ncbi:MAG: nucleoid-associated protein YgaU [Spirosomataceae bacterium]
MSIIKFISVVFVSNTQEHVNLTEIYFQSKQFKIIGLMSFFKGVGEKLFNKTSNEPEEKQTELKAQALLDHIQGLGLTFKKLIVKVQADTVTLEGEVTQQVDAEKVALDVGNVEGVAMVDNKLTVADPKPEAQFHTVESGEYLSKIAKKYYGDSNKYNVIFEANKPILSDPDKIYPERVLRIPPID